VISVTMLCIALVRYLLAFNSTWSPRLLSNLVYGQKNAA